MTELKKPNNTEQEEEYKVEELFLLHLRYKAALLEKLGNNAPILLNDPTIGWVVYAGWVDVFVVPLNDGKTDGVRRHLFRVPAGQALFGMQLNQNPNGVGLLAVGSNNASLLKVKATDLKRLGADEELGEHVASLIDYWIKHLSDALTTLLPPKESILLDTDQHHTLREQQTAVSKKGVLWIRHAQGKSYFMGNKDLPTLNGKIHWPISDHIWLETAENSRLEVKRTPTFLQQTADTFTLEPFHQLVLTQLARWAQQIQQEDLTRLQNKIETNQEVVEDAFAGLARQFTSPKDTHFDSTPIDNPLLSACQLVGERLNVEIKDPPLTRQGDGYDLLTEIARSSRLQMRRVALRGEWWNQNSGPLIANIEGESKQPVALLPKPKGGYDLHNPQHPHPLRVDEAVSATLEPFAVMFYKPFPAKAISLPELVRFGIEQSGFDLRNIALYGLGVSLLGLFIPVATGLIVSSIIPNGDTRQIIQVGILLIFAALATSSLTIVQNIALLRLQGAMGTNLQAAMWDRLLNLPPSFFRDYTAGDLGSRVMGIRAIEQTMSGPVLQALLMGVFSISSFALLFYYNAGLAVLASILVTIAVSATIWAGKKQVHYQRILTKLQGHLSGVVLQTITGISKFRAAGVEGHAFAAWAKDFSSFKQAGFKARDTANHLSVFQSAFPVVTSMAIFGMVTFSLDEQLNTGQFLAFNVAFVQFFTAVLALSQAYVAILNVVPLYERVKPILETLPEVDEQKTDPGVLTGKIEVSHLSFRYKADGPLILKDISLTINPGEFVALVGSSGSGKSTLFRLLLGFESPESGAVYYDGHDLAGIDVREVRRQLGVVLQDGKVMSGDIFTNIIGSSLMTIDDAWAAARMAGLDKDIKTMPMGMHTVISEGGGTLSGGQRQRLLIARALVNKPRVLYFDEATSALDNRTQAIVSESLDNLHSTRVVIAHRLSTIVNADRIFVLENGRIAQQGTYQELMQQDGLFADLAKRQMA